MHKDAGLSKFAAVGHEKHLLIDGSNILHAWAELRTHLENREIARETLSQMLRIIHDVELLRVTLIFDGRGEELVVEHPGEQKTYSRIYTPTGTTADDVIEQLVGAAADPAKCVVATDDRAERQTVEALGASALSADELHAWVSRLASRQDAQLKARRQTNEKIWRHKIKS